MSSCCGNELFINSVISEIVTSNLEQASYFINIVYNSRSILGIIVLIGFVVFLAARRIGVKFYSQAR